MRAKALLSEKNIPFEEIDLSEKPDELMALKKKTGFQTVPQIFIGNELIGGFTDLQKLDIEGELENKLK